MKHIFILLGLLLLPFSAQSVEYHWQNKAGQEKGLDALKGKPVILHFWASWCPPCRTELPAMHAWMKAHSDVNVVVISLDSDQADAAAFYAEKDLHSPLNMGDMREASKLGIRGLPTTIILDAAGEVVQRHMGDLNWADEQVSQGVLQWF